MFLMTGLVHMQVIVNLFTSKDKEINKSVIELIHCNWKQHTVFMVHRRI